MRGILARFAFAGLALAAGVASQERPELPKLYVIGDSTANRSNRRGWADPLADYFDPDKITIVNRACGGRSARSFLTEGLWNRTLADLKPGDYVLIQFGHNDGGARINLPLDRTFPALAMQPSGSRCLMAGRSWFTRLAGIFVNLLATPKPKARIRLLCP